MAVMRHRCVAVIRPGERVVQREPAIGSLNLRGIANSRLTITAEIRRYMPMLGTQLPVRTLNRCG